MDYSSLAHTICATAYRAGQVIMDHYLQHIPTNGAPVLKDDGSPVTQADLAANQIILDELAKLTPSLPIISEETFNPDLPPQSSFWLVDPLDGTKQYLAHTGEFTVNIALIENYRPVLGAIYVPTQDRIFVGYKDIALTGRGTLADEPLFGRDIPSNGLDVLYSRSEKLHDTDPFTVSHPIQSYHYVASSLKFCLIAQGRFDLFIRKELTYEWDTAAGQAIVEAAGGCVLNPQLEPLTYQKPSWKNTSFMVLGRK